MWDTRVVDKMEEVVGRFLVSCKFKSVVDLFEWEFTKVYGPNSVRERRLLWKELFGLSSWWNVPWCVGGDFNVVRFPSERAGSTVYTAVMHEFFDFISKKVLINLPLEAGTFTWSNSREVKLKARLDRFLFSVDREDKFPTVCQHRMFRLLSNHFLIVLMGGSF